LRQQGHVIVLAACLARPCHPYLLRLTSTLRAGLEVYCLVWSPARGTGRAASSPSPAQVKCFLVPAPKPNLAPAPRRAFPHSADSANPHLSSWPSLPSRPQTHQESNEHRLPRR
jgi:hypothetical protein